MTKYVFDIQIDYFEKRLSRQVHVLNIFNVQKFFTATDFTFWFLTYLNFKLQLLSSSRYNLASKPIANEETKVYNFI